MPTYETGLSRNSYYAGSFFIDTGIDADWSDPASDSFFEGMQAKVSATYSPSSAGVDWYVSAMPVCGRRFGAAETIYARVFIKCDVYALNPASLSAGASYTLGQVKWALYRI